MIEPFLKWAGGKRWLVNQYGFHFPNEYSRYIEPFLGGGAVFFWLCPKVSILADVNEELINAYTQVKCSPKYIEEELQKCQQLHSARFYIDQRTNTPKNILDRAVRFIYLNRTCWNGLYRVNLRGQFNVPIGTKNIVEYPPGYLQKVSSRLKEAEIISSDFERVIDMAQNGDFVYADPPYTVAHNTNNFIKYNSKLFSWQDQIRLCRATERAARRGATVMVSNADHQCIRELYNQIGICHRVHRTSKLAADTNYRISTTELLISVTSLSCK
ncbi:MAG TPA: Dam family site-specific DNA-(adenine-N6)-methyltransferase [Candidatus Fermentibacter daniensis]|nr:Dam family site-specific DNA-(adenine-N6)-methyltransferase [Candidatus Fermentibacter daniensis]HOR06518.1 Dam family site-specific DNA-(adenine-N6)-methyltransferase [Candidatus Fermentibacter daniensis]HPK50747.1 Dam family site-specific DNA-(adenine-N6)-methyltransferase [Candidatus Fermentibacter daniensis]